MMKSKVLFPIRLIRLMMIRTKETRNTTTKMNLPITETKAALNGDNFSQWKSLQTLSIRSKKEKNQTIKTNVTKIPNRITIQLKMEALIVVHLKTILN